MLRVLLATASVTVAAACVNAEQPAPPAAGPTVSYGNAAPTATDQRHNRSDVLFLDQAIQLRRQTSTLVHLAATNSPDESVRALATEIDGTEQPSITDAQEWLRQWHQPTPSGPPSPDPVPDTRIRQLSVTHGAEFDRQWAEDIGLVLTDSSRVTSTERVEGEYPPAKAMALQWATEIQDEQHKLADLRSSL